MSFASTLQDRGLLQYLRWVRASSQVAIEGAIAGSTMLTLWHEWMLCVLAGAHGLQNIAVYVWDQPDIERSMRVVTRLGFHVIVARRSNAWGVRAMREWLGAGQDRIVAITLDGPAGPRRIAKPGVVRLARLAGVPLCPLDVSASSEFELQGWDRCVMPRARGHITLRILPEVSASAPAAEVAQSIERRLNEAPAHVGARSPSRLRGLPGLAWARACTLPLQLGTVTVGARR